VLLLLAIPLIGHQAAGADSTAPAISKIPSALQGYVYHDLTQQEVDNMKLTSGVGEQAKNNNIVLNGHGTGLTPPTEEEYQQMVGSVFVDSVVSPPTAASVRLDQSPYFPPIGNQGSQGSCAAWATTYYANTYLQAELHGWTDTYSGYSNHIMSPAWTYNKENGGSDSGSSIVGDMMLVDSVGSSSLSTMPYSPSDYTSWGGETAWREAPQYRAGDYQSTSITDVAAIKSWLSQGYAVVFPIDASVSWYYDY
jgi:hypothetical protein